ncbi:MAG: winged helix-turn-helix domain-containing protein [Pseudomonadota bacterium]
MLYRFDGFTLDSDRFILTAASGEPVALQPRALELLLLLVRNSGAMVSKETIMKEVWGGLHVSRSALPLQVRAIREALGDDTKPHRRIETVHGKGLRFNDAVQIAADTGETAHPISIVLADPGERDGLKSEMIGKRPTIAVLPFSEPGQIGNSLGLGAALPVDIITALSQHRAMRVTARASSFLLDASTASPLAVRSALGADYSLGGQVSQMGDRFAIFVELCRTTSQHIIWAEQFEIDARDIHQMREQIVGQIIAQIEHQIPRSEAGKIALRQPDSLTAWQAFHVGATLVYRRGEDNMMRARRYFERAVNIDPSFARAWTGLAHTYAFEINHKPYERVKVAQRMLMMCAEKALAADPDDPAANMTMGRATGFGISDESPQPWFETALELSPSYAFAHEQLGLFLALHGDAERATEHSSTSILLSPQGPERFSAYANLALISLKSDDIAGTIKWGGKAGQVNHDDAYSILAGMCASHFADDPKQANHFARRYQKAFPGVTQRELLTLFNNNHQMKTKLSDIYSTYGIN